MGSCVVALCAATRSREAGSSLLYFPIVSRAYTPVNRRKGVAVNYRIITGAATARLLIGTAMYQIFISHASAEFGEAKARKDWLVQQDPPRANDILLAADMVRPGPRWTDELNRR